MFKTAGQSATFLPLMAMDLRQRIVRNQLPRSITDRKQMSTMFTLPRCGDDGQLFQPVLGGAFARPSSHWPRPLDRAGPIGRPALSAPALCTPSPDHFGKASLQFRLVQVSADKHQMVMGPRLCRRNFQFTHCKLNQHRLSIDSHESLRAPKVFGRRGKEARHIGTIRGGAGVQHERLSRRVTMIMVMA